MMRICKEFNQSIMIVNFRRKNTKKDKQHSLNIYGSYLPKASKTCTTPRRPVALKTTAFCCNQSVLVEKNLRYLSVISDKVVRQVGSNSTLIFDDEN